MNGENHSYQWITFLRNPVDRFVSHFYYDWMRSKGFRYKKYSSMKGQSLEEWNSVENVGDYQTRFIAGENNIELAKEILAKQFSWVGITEEFGHAITSFAAHFALRGFNLENKKSNRRRKSQEMPQLDGDDMDS